MMFPNQLNQSNTFNSSGMISKFYNKVDWRGRCETLAGKARLRETPQEQRAPRADRPRKASAWNGNQRLNCTNHKESVDKLDFHLVCLQSGSCFGNSFFNAT
ncbi:hypothetical protein BS1321_16360 [Peribacillus simplex NBRC 15720 = DSM 1321]|uniref:Uncharacterized protein n=1 Tax=Peribacillus simplex NBRC 15720 = DSM 1321 TaxID=1349754 RepID=A0A223EJC0_9BACI|nr:hypothetical protein BS1321_16360 [Peribacillus simplex NBRC 15720 = DSM 1321]